MKPTAAMTINNMFTDLKYFLVSGFTLFLENAPAPKEITIKKRNTKNSITNRISNFPSIILLNIVVYLRYFNDILS